MEIEKILIERTNKRIYKSGKFVVKEFTSFAREIITPPPAKNNGFFARPSILIARFNCPICTLVFGL